MNRLLVFLALCVGLAPRLFATGESGISFELLATDDIVMEEFSLYLLYEKTDYQTVVSYNHSDFWIDYAPPADALVGTASDQYAQKNSLRVASQGPLGMDLVWFAEVGGYVGFLDYQSLWIDEYYRQLFEAYPGYETSDPMGADAVLALRWDYLRESGFFKVSMFGGSDRIPPQWEPEIGEPLEPTDSTVNFIGTRLEFENLLSTRFRTHNSLTVANYSSRSPRFSFETMDNHALTDSWVLKGTLGGAVENPDYNAWWTTFSAEWDSRQTWFMGVNFRYYSDSGEINEFTNYGLDAPPAKTFGASATLRWVNGAQQASFSAGPYWTTYKQSDNTSPVSVLFQDRSWLWLQAGWSCKF